MFELPVVKEEEIAEKKGLVPCFDQAQSDNRGYTDVSTQTLEDTVLLISLNSQFSRPSLQPIRRDNLYQFVPLPDSCGTPFGSKSDLTD